MIDGDMQMAPDPVTKLLRWQTLTWTIARYESPQSLIDNLGVIYADIDNQQLLNCTYGHQLVDQVLLATGQKLETVVKLALQRSRTVRAGGDEFALFLPEVEGIVGVEEIAVTILRAFDTPVEIDEITFTIPNYGKEQTAVARARLRSRIAEVAPRVSTLEHAGGDYFVLQLPETQQSDVVRTVDALLRAFGGSVASSKFTLDLRLSIGTAFVTGSNVKDGLHLAENAMYEAKMRGKARAVCLEPEWMAL